MRFLVTDEKATKWDLEYFSLKKSYLENRKSEVGHSPYMNNH